jgi:hypothetical protein
MLLQKQQTVPYIGVFKLNSGEEFIGRVERETETSYTISKPLCMVQAGEGLRFAPLVMMGDLDEDINLPKPVITASPNKQIRDQYEEATSAIAMPRRGGIVTL